MERIGIRELRQHASTWVGRAATGETLEITDRGRAVARLGPIPASEDGLEHLRSTGRLTPAEGRLSEIEPLPAEDDTPDLSSLLADLRSDER